MFVSLLLAVTGLAQPAFSEDPQQYSTWLQHGCRLQQVGYSGGEPADHTEFCACFDAHVSDAGDEATYRVFALGMQGALRERSLIEDWEGARDTAAAEAGAMPLTAQAGFGQTLQDALLTCMPLSYQGE
ncbi:hypothetical protein [Maricaulis sp.]|uniref:hypothetical protein n=1 Tax=Maricaulis sp. TaxID=1486257 RepID=UPI003A8FF4B1